VRARILRRAGAAVVASTLLLAPLSPSVAHHRVGPCDFHIDDDETIQHYSKRHIRCAVRWFGPVAGGAERAICIARRESGLIPTAASPTRMYLGLFQHASEDWDRRYETYTEPEWELPERAVSGRTNAIVAIRMVAELDGIWSDAGWRRGDC
jgi:hypothetical protein